MQYLSDENVQLKRLRWQCRRGQLELDLLLAPFLEQVFSNLAEDEQRQFEALLAYPDPDVLAWCMGNVPPPETLRGIIKKIQKHAKSCHQN